MSDLCSGEAVYGGGSERCELKAGGSDERCLLSMGAEVILAINGGIEGSGPTYGS